MDSKTIAKVLERAVQSLRNAYWTMDIVEEALQEIEDQGRATEIWQIECICDSIKGQLEKIIERYKDLPF